MRNISKKIIRYFYIPVCPECFATVEKLQILFADEEIFTFEAFDMVQDKLVSLKPWFEAEKELLKMQKGIGEEALFFGKLFIEGEKVKGFPPSSKDLAEKFKQHGLEWNAELYPFEYSKQVNSNSIKCDVDEFIFKSYALANLLDVCQLCTLAHPYLDPEKYSETVWRKHEQQKEAYLQKEYNRGNVLGQVVYYEKKAVGFIEAFALPIAAQMCFPVSDMKQNGLMITCLSLCNEVTGLGLAKKLILTLEAEAKEQGYEAIETLAFPDQHGWQPRSLYEKLGYKPVKQFKDCILLKKTI